MRDERRREIQWGKKYPQLMLCSARYRKEPTSGEIGEVDITFPDGSTIGSDDPAVHAKLTELVGTEATLWPLQPAANVEFYKRYKESDEQFMQDYIEVFAREGDEPLPDPSQFPEILMDHVAVPGTFFDNEEVHLMTTASLDHMKSLNPEASWDVRRFRPNFLVETVEELAGPVEQSWVGRRLTIGTAILTIAAPTPRCGMTTRPQGDLKYDSAILRTIVRETGQNLGVGVHCSGPGEIREGDAVQLS